MALNFLGVQKQGDFSHGNLVLKYDKFYDDHFEASDC